MNLYWMSFCDTALPKGQRFLGVLIVEAATLADAMTATHLAGVNPGGEVSIVEMNLARVQEMGNARRDIAAILAAPRLELLSIERMRGLGLQPERARPQRKTRTK